MPVAIVCFTDGTIPALLAEDTPEALLKALRALPGAPDLASETDAREWLARQPAPAGWFSSAAEASAAARRLNKPEMSADEFRSIREALGMTRVQFGRALGYEGRDPNVNKQIWEMEKGAKPVLGDRANKARALAVTACDAEEDDND